MATKEEILKSNGTWNEKTEPAEEAFSGNSFFDPHDHLQVKYELLRSVAVEGMSVTEATKKYGVSRQTYYEWKHILETEGMLALGPKKKRGPKDGSKLNIEGKQFIDEFLKTNPNASAQLVTDALQESLGIVIHVHTVRRYLKKKDS